MVEIVPLDPHHAEEADLVAFHAVVLAAQGVDQVDEDPISYESLVTRLRNPFAGFGDLRHWLARRDGEVVGTVTLMLFDDENSDLVMAEITVHPKLRRQGIGTAVLRALLPEMVGRAVLEGAKVTAGGAGEAWAVALGFRKANATILQRLRFADVDPALWAVPAPDGYRVERWAGSAPDDLVESYAEARSAIHDAPRGDAEFRQPDWTVDRVRATEAENQARGVDERVVVAVHEASGTVVGLTLLELNPRRPGWGYQRDTAVLAAHRGHGLGRVIKAEMLRWLTPLDLDLVYTGTNADNVHMARVNHSLGFTTVRSMLEVNQPVEALREALDRRRGK
ncbi:GNAT family N-acetyltransferase [Umezawaea sp. NPDC059074]|uniref:GNAT family N-acetyltransferase n=1 Tax=Umezawaea sp. NPDC059074 TaxID=3346716 RepID=UPI0036BCBBF2